jgi:hypothetical protein
MFKNKETTCQNQADQYLRMHRVKQAENLAAVEVITHPNEANIA